MYKTKSGFTIVELLIVIVVIAILAAISIVAYNGINDRADRSAAASASTQAIKRIELAKINNGDKYPASVTDCPTPAGTNICLSDNSFSYRYNGLTSTAASGLSGTLVTPAYEISVEGDRQFVYKSTAEIRGVREFMQYMDMAPIIDKYGLKKYQISFEIKTDVAGGVNVYMQNGSGAKYSFSASVTATTVFSKQTVVVTPTVWGGSETKSILAFYGVYDSGRIPTVKNVEISLAP